jgi:DnaJ-domain-containing protein 1
VVWSGVTRNAAFVRQALRVAAEQAAAERTAGRFRHAAASEGPRRQDPGAAAEPAQDDVYRAYQTLGVQPTATDREVYQAWRKRRVENHPDHAAQDPAEFARRSRISAEINRARDVIEAHRAGRPHGARAAAS